MEEIFEFIASNPATILIVAGVLFLFASLYLALIDVGISKSASVLSFLLIGLGVVLHILWLFAGQRK
jgi:hypothetical protein